MKLNPKWLGAAVVYTEDGTRLGTIGEVHADGRVKVFGRGVEQGGEFFNAKQLDAAGLIRKPDAIHPKYL